jgi:hypothetical protein
MSVDTLSLARELRAADLAGPQAEAIAAAIGRAVTEGAATKADLESLEHRLSTKIEAMGTRIEASRSSMLVWFIGIQVTVGALIVALVKL